MTYDLDLDGATSTDERFLVAFANGREYGNGFTLAADGDPSDGWLDVCRDRPRIDAATDLARPELPPRGK